MPRSIALNPVVTRSGTTQVVTPPAVVSHHIALDPLCRQFGGDQTVILSTAT